MGSLGVPRGWQRLENSTVNVLSSEVLKRTRDTRVVKPSSPLPDLAGGTVAKTNPLSRFSSIMPSHIHPARFNSVVIDFQIILSRIYAHILGMPVKRLFLRPTIFDLMPTRILAIESPQNEGVDGDLRIGPQITPRR